MRELAAWRLSGLGIEVGALAAPFPAPVNCNIVYADYLSYREILETHVNEPVRALVIPSIKSPFETLDGISDGGLDFVIASHVIEHTRDPVGTIINAYKKLRPGGSLLLVIPDMERTWDRGREVATLEHLVADYQEPDPVRDQDAYREFFTICFPNPPNPDGWKQAWAEGVNIHFHAWNFDAFKTMIDWIVSEEAPFSRVWSHPTSESGDEFYFTLTK